MQKSGSTAPRVRSRNPVVNLENLITGKHLADNQEPEPDGDRRRVRQRTGPLLFADTYDLDSRGPTDKGETSATLTIEQRGDFKTVKKPVQSTLRFRKKLKLPSTFILKTLKLRGVFVSVASWDLVSEVVVF